MAPAARPPELHDAFQVGGRVGGSATSTVFEGTQRFPARRVAIRRFHVERPDLDADALADLLEPMRAFGGDRTPFVLAGGLDAGRPWVATAWVSSHSLSSWAQTATEQSRANLLIAVCEVLDRAHAQGLAHGALTAGRIRLTRDGLFVLDLGLAQVEAALGLRTEPGIAEDIAAVGTLAAQLLRGSVAYGAVVARATAPRPADRFPRGSALALALAEATGQVEHPRQTASVFARQAELEVEQDDSPLADALLQRLRAVQDRTALPMPTLQELVQALDAGVLRNHAAPAMRLRLLLAETSANHGLTDEAIAQADAALALAPEVPDPVLSARAHIVHAHAWCTRNDIDRADKALDLAAARLPEDHPTHLALAYARARVCMLRGDSQTAVAWSLRAVDTPLPSLDARLSLTVVLCRLGRYEEARAHAEAALEQERRRVPGAMHIGLARVYGRLGMIHGELEEHDTCVALTRKAVDGLRGSLPPGNPVLLRMIGVLTQGLIHTGRADEAVAMLQQAIRDADVSRPYVLASLCWACEAAERWHEAREAGEAALAALEGVDKHHLVPMVQGSLGAVCARLGDPASALSWLDQALATLDTWDLNGPSAAKVAELRALQVRLRRERTGSDVT